MENEGDKFIYRAEKRIAPSGHEEIFEELAAISNQLVECHGSEMSIERTVLRLPGVGVIMQNFMEVNVVPHLFLYPPRSNLLLRRRIPVAGAEHRGPDRRSSR